MRRLAFVVSLLLVAGITDNKSGAAATTIDKEMFVKLTPDERVKFAISCLENREQLLENFSYKLLVKSYNFDISGKKVLDLGDVAYSVARSGDKCCLHMQTYKGDGTPSWAVTNSWDGKKALAMAAPEHKGDVNHCGISDSEPINIQNLSYNVMLGYRIIGKMSVSQFIRIPFENPRNSVVVELDELDGARLLLVHITERGYTHYRLWFDPERGYMLVRYEYGDVSAKEQDWKKDPTNFCRVTITDAKKIGDVWVPMKGTLESGCKTFDVTTRRTYEVQQIRLDKPAADDLVVNFPPGAEVIDRIKNLAYVIQNDGSKEFMDMYDSGTGKVISATQQAAKEAASTKPTTLPSEK